jgi:hypothetical protein
MKKAVSAFRAMQYCNELVFINVSYKHVAGQIVWSWQPDGSRCFVKVSKHVNNIEAIARQPPITTIEERL